jgi:hypothetical protein
VSLRERQERSGGVGGSRRGRQVHIETVGKRSYTWVQAGTPPFEIHSQAGKLVADKGAPEAVIEALKGLRKAKRWRGVAAPFDTASATLQPTQDATP